MHRSSQGKLDIPELLACTRGMAKPEADARYPVIEAAKVNNKSGGASNSTARLANRRCRPKQKRASTKEPETEHPVFGT